VIVGENSIHCNGWKDEGCEVEAAQSAADCTTTDIGIFNGYASTGNKLCFTDGTASRTVPLPNNDNVKMIAFSATEANVYYGAAIEDIVFLSISKDIMKVIAAPKPTTDSYYFNQFAGKDEKNVLIKCNSSGCSKVNFHSGTGLNNNAIIDSGDPMKKSIVYQSNSRYEYHDRTSDLKSSKLSFVNQLDPSKVIICTDADGCTLETGSVIAGHAYIDNKANDDINTFIIICEGQKCEVKEISEYIQDDNTLYYIDGKETNKVIFCNTVGTGKCVSMEGSTANAHAYVYKDANKDTKSIITCNSTGCTVTKFSTTDLSSEKKFIYGGDIEYLIICTTSGCAKDGSKGSGSFEDGSDSNRTINCVSGKGCISSAAISSVCGTINGDSPCKDSSNNSIGSGYYCYSSENIIYESTEDGKCEAKTEDVLIEKEGKKYKAAEWGISSTGIIYFKNSNNEFEQVISSYNLYEKGEEKYLYKCDESGNCMIVNKISIGYYLSGKPEVGAELKYKQLIQCTDTIATSCSKINELPSGYYVDAGNLNNVIVCDNESMCNTKESNKNQGVAYIDNGDANIKSYITCNEEKCESITTNLTGDEKLYFIDGSSDTKLIECSRSGCVSQNAVVGKALDGTDKNYTITCVSGNNGGATCVSEKECRVNTGGNCEDSKYYNVQAANPTDYILEKGTSSSDEGTVYYCKEDTEKDSGFSCSKMDSPGYYINSKDEIYKCEIKTGQLKCTVYTIGACGSSNNIGELFIDGNGKLNLCVNYSNGKAYPVLIDSNSNTSSNYLIQKSEVTVFGIPDGANAIVKVDRNSAAINKNYKFTKDYYVYVNKETFAVLNSNQCPSHQNMLITDVVEEYQKCDDNYIKKSC